MRNEGRALLSGNVFCGHCGGRIFASTGRKSHHKDQSKDTERIPIYKCYTRSQYKERCDGAATYRAKRVDDAIEVLLRDIFRKTRVVDYETMLVSQIRNSIEESQRKLRRTKAELEKNLRERDRWESLMLDSMDGTCAFSPMQIRRRLDTVQANIDQLTQQTEKLQRELEDADEKAGKLKAEHERLLTWADLYDSASTAEKKMICGYMIRRVTICRGYELEVELNISEAQYLRGLRI